ncbi:hypothetical protein BD410DRAFT_782794 [Rickenella mellea]|uniref:F-box domain-containing protein n=1 Tax=Rickenella mellea TaxID=50990 RepID=A0A4Y7QK93_9AGAM|nr:hypothetical protein BD410DRAFT_782794 [Rickenella mellea]
MALSHSSSCTLSLPVELWRFIIQEATYTHTYLNQWESDWPPSYDRTLQSYQTALRTKTALTLVSRHFRDITAEFLYEIVHLRSIHHAQLFLDLHYTDDVCAWTKYLLVKQEKWESASVLTHAVAQILRQCRNLRGFGCIHYTDGRPVYSVGQGSRAEETLIKAIPPGVQFLDWDQATGGKFFSRLAPECTTSLRGLRLWSSDLLPPDVQHESLASNTTFPYLTHLHLNRLGSEIVHWKLPSLIHFSLNFDDSRRLHEFLGIHSSSLISLSLGRFAGLNENLLKQVLLTQYNLRELAYCLYFDGPEPTPLWACTEGHNSLAHLHITCIHWPTFPLAYADLKHRLRCHVRPLDKVRFPKLQTVTITGVGWAFTERRFVRCMAAEETTGSLCETAENLSVSLSQNGLRVFVLE